MHKLTFFVFCLMLCASGALAQTTDLIISEYVEGSGSNKALEIFNGTEDAVNLGGYTIKRYSNGSVVATNIALNAVDLQPGDAYVIGSTSADANLMPYLDQTNGNINFNGDDALELVFGGSVIIDSFGTVGVDPGSYWNCAEGNTANHTLRRLSSICDGDVVSGDSFDPCSEWSFALSDDFSDLGQHTADCGTVATEYTDWGNVKALYR